MCQQTIIAVEAENDDERGDCANSHNLFNHIRIRSFHRRKEMKNKRNFTVAVDTSKEVFKQLEGGRRADVLALDVLTIIMKQLATILDYLEEDEKCDTTAS